MTNTPPFMKVVDICDCKHNRRHAMSMIATPRGRDRLFFLDILPLQLVFGHSLALWLRSRTYFPSVLGCRVVARASSDLWSPVTEFCLWACAVGTPLSPCPIHHIWRKKEGGFEGLVASSATYAPLESPMDHDLTEITGSWKSCCYLSWIIRHNTFECLKLKQKKHSFKALHFWKKVNSVILLAKSPRKHNSQPLSQETLKNVYDQSSS